MAYVDWLIKGPEDRVLQLRLRLPLRVQRPADPRRVRRARGASDRAGPVRRGAPRRPDRRRALSLAGAGARGRRHGRRASSTSARARRSARRCSRSWAARSRSRPRSSTSTARPIAKELEPIFAPIEFACDIAARTGRLVVPGVMELTIEPIRNPVTGVPHRALIRLPEGFEFREAEVGSGTFRGRGRRSASPTGLLRRADPGRLRPLRHRRELRAMARPASRSCRFCCAATGCRRCSG